MKQVWLALIALVLVTTGCGPVYETEYQLIPPRTAEGRMCVTQCQQTQMYCVQNCRLQEQSCLANERQRAMWEYQRYVNEQNAKKLPIKRSASSFENTWRCSTNSCEERCDSDHRMCFSSCGGQVIPHKVCTMFCDGAKK